MPTLKINSFPVIQIVELPSLAGCNREYDLTIGNMTLSGVSSMEILGVYSAFHLAVNAPFVGGAGYSTTEIGQEKPIRLKIASCDHSSEFCITSAVALICNGDTVGAFSEAQVKEILNGLRQFLGSDARNVDVIEEEKEG